MVREALLVLQLGEAAAERQHAAAEVAVRGKLATEVLGRPAVEQVAAAGALSERHSRLVEFTLQHTTSRVSLIQPAGIDCLFLKQ